MTRIISFLTLLMILVVSLLAPWFPLRDPQKTNATGILQPPSQDYLLGTDSLGRDVLSRTIYGGRQTLAAAGGATLIGILSGTLAGTLLSSMDGVKRSLALSILNSLLAFPSLLLALIILTLAGAGLVQIIFAAGFIQIAFAARIVDRNVIYIRSRDFVESAIAMGASPLHIFRWHIVPYLLPVVLVYSGVVFSYSIFNIAALSLLGLSGNPALPDWGIMLATGREGFRSAPWAALVPGTAITVTLATLNNLIDFLSSRYAGGKHILPG